MRERHELFLVIAGASSASSIPRSTVRTCSAQSTSAIQGKSIYPDISILPCVCCQDRSDAAFRHRRRPARHGRNRGGQRDFEQNRAKHRGDACAARVENREMNAIQSRQSHPMWQATSSRFAFAVSAAIAAVPTRCLQSQTPRPYAAPATADIGPKQISRSRSAEVCS